MLLSVIVPVYNAEGYIGECLNSLLAQTYSNIEVLLIEDCSTDRSRLICDKYASRDERIKVYYNDINKGVSYSRNFGIQSSRGDYIMFVDADDKLDKDYINDVFHNCDVDIVVSSFIYNASSVYKVPIHESIYRGSEISMYLKEYSTRFTSSWAKVYKSSLIKMNNILFDHNCSHGEDTLFLYDCISKAKSIETKKVYGYYYNVENNDTLSKASKTYTEYLHIIKEINNRLEKLSNLYDWPANEASLEMTEYFLSRIILRMKNMKQPFSEKVVTLRRILELSYIQDVMRDTVYLCKGRKRRLFDFLSTCGCYRLAVIFLNYCSVL